MARSWFASLLILLFGTPAGAEPPAPLRCLTRYYNAGAAYAEGAWHLVLPDGRRVPYDDGKEKTLEQRLAHPDVEDVFSIKYRRGPIVPVSREDEDPGRVRIDALFAATYGRSRAELDLVRIVFLDQRLSVHRKAAPAFLTVAARLGQLVAREPSLRPFLRGLGGTVAWRNIAGTERRSAHSYGISLDINVSLSHYWRWQKGGAPAWQNQVPQAIVDAFEEAGFIWGGRWYHYDTMHFEYRPELLDPACYPPAR